MHNSHCGKCYELPEVTSHQAFVEILKTLWL